ncbi:MAG TPA: hypothetical protein VHP32_01425 [Ignavibacteria bacterium]|nr:hypothetical protein [Ignavibacteria bacterium]
MSCEKDSDKIIDVNISYPTISNPLRSPDTVYTLSGSPSIVVATSVDVTSEDAIKQVICSLIDSKDSVIGQFQMLDNGVSPDTTANDRRYTALIAKNGFGCLIVGGYKLQYYAETNEGLFSNIITTNMQVRFSNSVAPVLSNPVLPDSVVRPTSGQFDITLEITATDANGQCDVSFVYFDAYRPTGTYLGPIPMFSAGGSLYKFINPVPPAVPDSLYGYYKYHFYAVDNSGLISNTIIDSIKFVRP